jgi:hypothetical protein
MATGASCLSSVFNREEKELRKEEKEMEKEAKRWGSLSG